MLLATSMVLTSVNVAPIFADEYIEEADFGTTENASAEVDLSDDFGVTEDASDEANTATEEQAFFDEEITDEVVEDEEPVADQVVTEDAAYDENADIYEALEQAQTAADDAAYEATDVPVQLSNENVTVTLDTAPEYDGTEKTMPVLTVAYTGTTAGVVITATDVTWTTGNTGTDAGTYTATGTINKTIENGDVNYVCTGTITKEWKGDEDLPEYRPEKIVVELFADGNAGYIVPSAHVEAIFTLTGVCK